MTRRRARRFEGAAEIESVSHNARFALRALTREAHERVDAAFGRFTIGERGGYLRLLTAHARALPSLEHAVDPRHAWSEWQPRMRRLADDIAELGGTLPPPLPTQTLDGAAATWGVQYVLEGSKLGGRMLARQVAEGLPRRYLGGMPDGEAWAEFQLELSVAAQDAAWLAGAARAALAAFALFEAAACEPELTA